MAARIGFGMREESSIIREPNWWGVGIGLTVSLGVSVMEFMNGNYLDAGIFGLVIPLGTGLLMRIRNNIVESQQLNQRINQLIQLAHQAIQEANHQIALAEGPQGGLIGSKATASGG